MKRHIMSKMKNIFFDVETRLISGEVYDDIITHLQSVLKSDRGTAQEWVDNVRGQVCIEEEREYYGMS